MQKLRLPKRFKSWRAKKTMIIVFLLVLTAILLGRFINSPAEGTIKESSANSLKSSSSSNTVTIDGTYLSFDYPSSYGVEKKGSGGLGLESYLLTSPAQFGGTISVSLIKESLTNDSSYNHRLEHPEIYKHEQTETGELFSSTQNGGERTVFVSQDGYVVIVSANGSSSQKLANDQQIILDSLKLK